MRLSTAVIALVAGASAAVPGTTSARSHVAGFAVPASLASLSSWTTSLSARSTMATTTTTTTATTTASLAVSAFGSSHSRSFRPSSSASSSSSSSLATAVAASAVEESLDSSSGGGGGGGESTGEISPLDFGAIKNLSFRELRRECKDRDLPAGGNTAALRGRLMEYYGIARNGAVSTAATTTSSSSSSSSSPSLSTAAMSAEELLECDPEIEFCDEADKDFDYNSLRSDVLAKANMGHWKAATRKLRKLQNQFETDERKIDRDAYLAVLMACASDRLHGARASEPARKVMEEMSVRGYDIPPDVGNGCVVNCLGTGPNGTHEGCGGIDVALAMLAAMESSPSGSDMIGMDSYGSVASALAKDGAIDEAIVLLRAMVVEHAFTPPLGTFADVALAAAKDGKMGESVLQVLTLAKAAGYELDKVASAEAGRDLLASGVVAAQQMDNVALGLRLLTAAGKAEGCAPDRGDDLVAASSSMAQRACTLIHKSAIDKAVQDDNWKLAVKLLQLMPERSLKPSNSVWRKVVTCCARSEKSKKSTALLLDWVKLYEEGKADKPPVSVFNTVVNACEICGEEELTLTVLDSMRKTHNIDGNIITTNIALKRLAKLGNTAGCEGIIIGMLQAGMEPNVVSYTTAIGACATEPKNPAFAYEWIKRMRSRNVRPNFHTYNTALAACLDGRIESTALGSKIATEMLADVDEELAKDDGLSGSAADLKSVVPDSYTKVLARSLMKQLRENWRNGDIDMAVAKSTIRVPLLKLVDFQKSEAAAEAKKRAAEQTAAAAAATAAAGGKVTRGELDGGVGQAEEITYTSEVDMDYSAVRKISEANRRVAEV